MTTPTGSGSVKTYVTGAAATAYLDADLRLQRRVPPPDVVEAGSMKIHTAGFDSEDYMVVGGQPCGLPQCQVRMRSRSGVGAWVYSDAPPAPWDVDTGATLRWLPTSQTFAPDGSYWNPSVGAGMQLAADIGPYLDENYSFEVRGGDEVSLPAVIFNGDASMKLSDIGWSAAAFTFILVAVMHQNPEGPRYGLMESVQDMDLSGGPVVEAPTDWGLRYNQGRINFFAGARMVSHQMSTIIGRPVLFAISLDPVSGKLLVCDRTKSTAEFSTAGFALFDIGLLLGQTSTGGPNETAYMDVLELSYFDRSLGFDELNNQLHLLDSIYGIVS